MPNYRRIYVPGGTYFFTVTLYDRRSRLLTQRIDALREAVAETARQRPFKAIAWVVLPEHMHCLWALPPHDSDYPGRWRAIKTRFVKKVSDGKCLEGIVWQRRYWEHTIRSEEDFKGHFDYIHYNPVKHGLVDRVSQWPYSTWHRYMQDGYYQPGWEREKEAHSEGFGERG